MNVAQDSMHIEVIKLQIITPEDTKGMYCTAEAPNAGPMTKQIDAISAAVLAVNQKGPSNERL